MTGDDIRCIDNYINTNAKSANILQSWQNIRNELAKHDPNIQSAVDKVRHAVNHACQNLLEFKEKPIEEFAAIMKQNIVQIAGSMFKIQEDQIEFKADPDDKLAIIPANLYTLLLTGGISLSYEYVENHQRKINDDQVELDIPSDVPYYSGHTIIYEPSSSHFVLRLNKTLKYIKLDVTVTKNGTLMKVERED